MEVNRSAETGFLRMQQLSLDFDDTWADELIEWAINQQVPEYRYVEEEYDEDGVLLSSGYWVGLPRDKSVLVDLEELNLTGCLSTGIPEQIRFLKRLKILKLTDGLQASWGPEDFDKEPYCVSEMPWWLPNLKNLEVLDLSGNSIIFVSSWISELHSLKELNLSYNRIEFISDSLSKLKKLEKLWIYSPTLTFLNPSLKNLKELKELWFYGLPGSSYGPIELLNGALRWPTENGEQAISCSTEKSLIELVFDTWFD